jgi:DNA-directed RNA polymerase sigma subunit (sigma70/sigma32)
MTLKQIGEEIGLTRERVRQIEHDTLRKLRDTMFAEA